MGIVLLGGALRFYNSNWDENYFFHPDETKILIMTAEVEIPFKLQPKYYTYNGFSVYLYKLTGQILGGVTGERSWANNIMNLKFIARTITALVSTSTIVIVYYLAKEFFSKKWALLAALITALTVGLIQHAHFAVTETLLVFFLSLIMLTSIKLQKCPESISKWLLIGLFGGLAIGTKTTGIAFLFIPLVSGAMVILKKRSLKIVALAILSVLVVFLTFFVVSPYSLLNFNDFLDAMKFENAVVLGTFEVPWTIQFYNTPPFLFYLRNLLWFLGPLVSILGILGHFVWLWKIYRKGEDLRILPVLLFDIIYFLYVGAWFGKFIRYMLPLFPGLILAACWLIRWMWSLSKETWRKIIVGIIVGLTILVQLSWAFAFETVYSREHTRIAASEWIYKHVPHGSKLITETFDQALPVGISGQVNDYKFNAVKNYEADNEEKISGLAKTLADSDYYILSSRRFSGTIPRAPEKFPVTSKFYSKLFSGELGYVPVAKFTSYPNFLGFEINDDGAEETLQVFDHPTIYVFKKVDQMSWYYIENKIKE